MYYRNMAINRNICRTVLRNGGSLTPLLISTEDSKGLGLMNPSIFVDDGELLVNLRNVNYTLYHAENKQLYNNRHGPLVYLHPEDDPYLRTTNFLLRLNLDFSVRQYFLVDTSTLDIDPVWDFVGLEDIRLVRWDKKLYGCGVRRDVKEDGEGRMELSELQFKNEYLHEVKRNRIQPPGAPTYCEKNWMPVLDKPYTFVKWTNPTEVVKVDLQSNTSKTIYLGENVIPDMPDLRGGSQVIPYKGHYICIVHDCDLFGNKMEQKDATYMHRWVIWDRKWNIVHISDPWSFMDGEIEFCCGLCEYKGDFLVTFGFQDNAAYLLKIPKSLINTIIQWKQ
jgi:hypothetical protein